MADAPVDPTTLLPRFGLSSFRPGQQDVVDCLSSGLDVMCVMPTGGGKSLCYQLPSLAREGTTIVVSPLIALMKDQVDALSRLGIPARLINSSLTPAEQAEVMGELAEGKLELIYVAPERLRNGRFLEAVSRAKITLLAVDEAHCVSEWGHDFRPDYSRLGRFRERYLKNVQTIALTATATPAVRDDIGELLGLRSPRVFVTGFARKNLRFGVAHAKSDREKDTQLTDYLSQQPGAGIIYAATRKRCEELAEWLPQKLRRSVGVYHAGLEPDQRRRVQEEFMAGKLSAIVATNAFGMGIDKSDIRFVVHYNMPGTLEAYYQEAGRAGRDGDPSDCMLLFSYQDRYVQEFFIENRYPSRETVRKVYEFLLACEQDPIELTLEQVRAAIHADDGTEAIGTAETLLAKAGVLKRMDSSSNQAVIRIDSDAPTMLDFLPKEARIRRRVMQAVEKVIGQRRGEDVYVQPRRLWELASVDRDQLNRSLRELRRLKAFDYVPPFRGRAVHMTERDVRFEDLEIDFEELERRKAAEFEKLEAVIGFARTSLCRQRVIMNYFGDHSLERCGSCDRCDSGTARSVVAGSEVPLAELSGVDLSVLLRAVQIILSGVTRMHGRFGKNLVAQMLCGSKSKKLQQWRLHQLSTYGLLAALRQTEVVAAIDYLVEAGLLEQKEVDDRRPTIHVSGFGKEVMLARESLPESFRLPAPLARRLVAAARGAGAEGASRPEAEAGTREATSAAEDHLNDLRDLLRRWRYKTSAALGFPAFRVFTNATLDRIAEAQPATLTELEAVPGVGPSTIEQFGEDILGVVEAWSGNASAEGGGTAEASDPTGLQVPADGKECRRDSQQGGESEDGPQQTGVSAASPSACADQSEPWYWTWQLFHDGYEAEEIAAIRRSSLATIMDELVAAASVGRIVRSEWVPDPAIWERIERATAPSRTGGAVPQ